MASSKPSGLKTACLQGTANSALRTCWAADPKRVWLHTDTNDHPNAMDVYRRAGFRLYAERLETFAD